MAWSTSLAIWHRGRSHRRPNRSESPNRRHFASLDLKSGCRKRGVEFKGGSRQDRNRQNRHGYLLVLYFERQAKEGQAAVYPCNNKYYILNSIPKFWCIEKCGVIRILPWRKLWCNICTRSRPSCSAIFTMQLFCLQLVSLEASCLQLSFFSYSGVWEFFSYSWCFYLQFELFAFSGAFSLTAGNFI